MTQTATVMFNGSLYQGEVLRTTAKRMLVKFTVPSSNTTRENWFTTCTRPEGKLVSRRNLAPGCVTLEANTAFVDGGAR